MRHMLALKYIDMVAKSGSIRSASEMLAITPSALNRRILSIEEELGIEIFERHAAGVRLNSAGELFIQHIRSQMADLERVRSRIADLSGVRMGRVRIAVTQEIGVGLLPKLIQNYRAEFPGVTFSITTCQRNELERRLQNLEADIAVAFQPANLADVHTLLHRAQPTSHCGGRARTRLQGAKKCGLWIVLKKVRCCRDVVMVCVNWLRQPRCAKAWIVHQWSRLKTTIICERLPAAAVG